jgi:hypothetical protein
MPWCEPCGRFYNPNTLNVDGTCPTCNTKLADPAPDSDTRQKPPWHFWLLLVAVSVYLGWRIVQLVLLAVN